MMPVFKFDFKLAEHAKEILDHMKAMGGEIAGPVYGALGTQKGFVVVGLILGSILAFSAGFLLFAMSAIIYVMRPFFAWLLAFIAYAWLPLLCFLPVAYFALGPRLRAGWTALLRRFDQMLALRAENGGGGGGGGGASPEPLDESLARGRHNARKLFSRGIEVYDDPSRVMSEEEMEARLKDAADAYRSYWPKGFGEASEPFLKDYLKELRLEYSHLLPCGARLCSIAGAKHTTTCAASQRVPHEHACTERVTEACANCKNVTEVQCNVKPTCDACCPHVCPHHPHQACQRPRGHAAHGDGDAAHACREICAEGFPCVHASEGCPNRSQPDARCLEFGHYDCGCVGVTRATVRVTNLAAPALSFLASTKLVCEIIKAPKENNRSAAPSVAADAAGGASAGAGVTGTAPADEVLARWSLSKWADATNSLEFAPLELNGGAHRSSALRVRVRLEGPRVFTAGLSFADVTATVTPLLPTTTAGVNPVDAAAPVTPPAYVACRPCSVSFATNVRTPSDFPLVVDRN